MEKGCLAVAGDHFRQRTQALGYCCALSPCCGSGSQQQVLSKTLLDGKTLPAQCRVLLEGVNYTLCAATLLGSGKIPF